MTDWLHLAFPWLVLATFGLTFASAIFPWMSVEIIVVALPAVAPSKGALVLLLLVATAGQMVGKCLLYWIGHEGSRRSGPRMTAAIERWGDRIRNWRSGPIGLVFFSAAVGLPPFFVVAAMVGALKIDFLRFLLAGTAGRLLRFTAIVAVVPVVTSLVSS